MNNIELFNLSVAETLAACYEEFPQKINFSSIDITDKVLGYYPEKNEGEYAEIIFPVATGTIQWLGQAGYLWIANQEQHEFLGVTLSPKGLELLNLIPDSISKKESIGSLLTGGLKSVGKESALALIKTVLSEGVKLSLKGGS